MKVLIATQNKSKFDIISKMIKSILSGEIEFKNLNEYPNFEDIEEIGNNIERAKAKAYNAKKQINDEFDVILGIDDGIILKNVEYTAVKEHLYDIIVGDAIKIGEMIYITRAYYLIAKDNKESYCFNKIPYVVRQKLNDLNQGGYPLNDVISTINDDIVLSDMTEEELNDYFLSYNLNDLKNMFKIINK